jgi:endonuclease/exonuclease/phosphatase (EEP) superfamily protein YafD
MSTTSQASSRMDRLKRRLPLVLAALALVHPLAAFLARFDWRPDLVSHFQEPALAVTLVALAAAIPRRKKLAVAMGVLALVQALPMCRVWLPNPVRADSSSDRIKIVMANVLADNYDYERLAALIEREQPDIIGLVEINRRWLDGLERLREQYPYQMNLPAGTRGMALWFRRPPESMDRPEQLVPEGNPLIHATFLLGGKLRHLWLVHPTNPLGHRGRRLSNRELAAIARRVADTGGSRLVVGDLNRTDGSPHFRSFERACGLRDSRLGFGREATWPVWSPYRIAIDHAFLSADLAVVSRRVGPDIGSDHFPLILEISPAESPSAATTAVSQVSASR